MDNLIVHPSSATPKTGERRNRNFALHVTPRPTFFDATCHPSSLSVKRHKRSRPATCTLPCSPMKSAPPIQRFLSQRRLEDRFGGADGAKSVSYAMPNSPLHNQNKYSRDSSSDYFEQNFRKISKLGEGDFGEVVEAQRLSDGKRFAIKKSRQPFVSKTDRERKFAEVKAFEQIPPHPNILKFDQAWEERGHLFIQTELCQVSLQQYMDEKPVDEVMTWHLFCDILTGLDHIHESGFIHLDIKPDNILIGYDGRYKIGDLGLMASKRGFAGATTTKNEYREGDNRYMAPETLQGVFTSRADVFSLGMTVLCVICDIELPKNGEMWHKLRSTSPLDALSSEDVDKIPEEMRVLMSEMLQRDFNLRPSCRDLLNNKIIAKTTLTMFLSTRSSYFRPNNNTEEPEDSTSSDIYRERSPAITPSSANRRSSGGTATPSESRNSSPQMSPLSTRCSGFRGRMGSEDLMETDSVPNFNAKVSKNLLSLFDAGESDDELDF